MPAKTAFFAEWHRFPPICPTADASSTFGMIRENSSELKCRGYGPLLSGCFHGHGPLLPLLSQTIMTAIWSPPLMKIIPSPPSGGRGLG
jgi:hypothetical protein